MTHHRKEQIYIRLIDGTESLVPVKAQLIESKIFRITENQYLDFKDVTSIWEFFPGDVVETELENNIGIAKKLVESAVPDRRLYQLIFDIVESSGHLKIDESEEQTKDAIKELAQRNDIIQKQHPTVKNWMQKQHSGSTS